MNNVNVTREGNTLVIRVDISPETVNSASYSKSGKTKLVASTHGFQRVEQADRLSVSLNVSARPQ